MNSGSEFGTLPLRLVVSDVDGTLLGRSGEISLRNSSAIESCFKRGVAVAISTGRPPFGVDGVIAKIGELYGRATGNRATAFLNIFADGAVVSPTDGSRDLFSRQLAKEDLVTLLDVAEDLGLPLQLYSSQELFASGPSRAVEIQVARFGISANFQDLRLVVEGQRIIKAGAVVFGPDRERIFDTLSSRIRDIVACAIAQSPDVPEAYFVNIAATGVSKGEALGRLAEALHVPTNQILAIGDSFNDIPLIEQAHVGIAMGNGVEPLKRLADHVTGDVEDDGFADAIQKFVLS